MLQKQEKENRFKVKIPMFFNQISNTMRTSNAIVNISNPLKRSLVSTIENEKELGPIKKIKTYNKETSNVRWTFLDSKEKSSFVAADVREHFLHMGKESEKLCLIHSSESDKQEATELDP